ncbi:hypothetical protein CVT24_012589 [Panaeolus cyanescens]|uniref:Uncharacterized protein n=1 Tax=Panaeolus cyanescens TaxID=181874 RepID=A0A409YJV0_9AGAR|nr:hypothetical protein CVT24_012589 [Panaeolus cyanescens]
MRYTSLQYAFTQDNYPLELSVNEHLSPVMISVSDSVRYGLHETGDDEREWKQLNKWPRGLGRMHLGEDYRLFNAVYFHQFHCVQIMQGAIQNRHYPKATAKHVNHCLNYLRQTLMCDADYTLEEGDFVSDYRSIGRGGNERVKHILRLPLILLAAIRALALPTPKPTAAVAVPDAFEFDRRIDPTVYDIMADDSSVRTVA